MTDSPQVFAAKVGADQLSHLFVYNAATAVNLRKTQIESPQFGYAPLR
jgi:hypothetical protein